MEFNKKAVEMELPSYSPGWRGLWEHLLGIFKRQAILLPRPYIFTMQTTVDPAEVHIYIDGAELKEVACE